MFFFYLVIMISLVVSGTYGFMEASESPVITETLQNIGNWFKSFFTPPKPPGTTINDLVNMDNITQTGSLEPMSSGVAK